MAVFTWFSMSHPTNVLDYIALRAAILVTAINGCFVMLIASVMTLASSVKGSVESTVATRWSNSATSQLQLQVDQNE